MTNQLNKLIDMLEYPNGTSQVSADAMIATVSTIFDRILKSDSTILTEHISQEEYDLYFKYFLDKYNFEEIREEMLMGIENNKGEKDES